MYTPHKRSKNKSGASAPLFCWLAIKKRKQASRLKKKLKRAEEKAKKEAEEKAAAKAQEEAMKHLPKVA